jgi:hypothetical protein
LLLASASYRHARSFDGVTEDKTLDSVPSLATFYGLYPHGDWDRIGDRLREELGGTKVIIATDAVGAIPYYSRIETVDLWGLNDTYVARQGRPVEENYRRPSHRRRAPMSYLRSRGVSLIVGHPTLVPADVLGDTRAVAPLSMWARRQFELGGESNGQATCLAMPVDGGMALLMIYLQRDAELDAVIAKRGWARKDVTF